MGRGIRIAAVIVLIVALAALGYHHFHRPAFAAPPSGPPAPAIRAAAGDIRHVRIAGISVTVAVSRHPNGTTVLFTHGANESPGFDMSQGSVKAPAIAALIRSGYGWAEAQTALENWGDRASVNANLALAAWLHRHRQKILLMSASMGGLDGEQILAKIQPVAWIGVYPVCNLRSILDRGEFQSQIASAHTDVSGLSPTPITGPSGLPVLLLSSPQDATVPKGENADVCAREARAAGMKVTEVATRGPHGDPSDWLPRRFVSWLRAATPGD